MNMEKETDPAIIEALIGVSAIAVNKGDLVAASLIFALMATLHLSPSVQMEACSMLQDFNTKSIERITAQRN